MTERSKKPAASRSAKRGRKGAKWTLNYRPQPSETFDVTVGDVTLRFRYRPPEPTRNPDNEDSIEINLRSARSELSHARHALRADRGVNLICGDISCALNWAMEAWLRRRFGKEPSGRSGWSGMWRLYRETAPKGLRERMSSASSAVHALETELIGPPPDWEFGGTTWRPAGWTVEGWKEKVRQEIERATGLVDEIERYATRKRRAARGRKPTSRPRT